MKNIKNKIEEHIMSTFTNFGYKPTVYWVTREEYSKILPVIIQKNRMQGLKTDLNKLSYDTKLGSVIIKEIQE